jgi:hypothetical protein
MTGCRKATARFLFDRKAAVIGPRRTQPFGQIAGRSPFGRRSFRDALSASPVAAVHDVRVTIARHNRVIQATVSAFSTQIRAKDWE